jgi:uncharacterized membrane protein YgcG
VLTYLIAASLALQSTDLPLPVQPEYGHYVVDSAQMLDVYSEHVIDSVGARRNDEGRPLYVVTLDSVPGDPGDRDRVYAYAKAIYAGWKIGANTAPNARVSRGTLLLLVKANGESALIFGDGWGGIHDGDGVRLTRDIFNPALASDSPDDAIVAGVRTLSNTVALRRRALARVIAAIPLIAIVLAFLSVGRIKRRNARRREASEALLATLAARLTHRQYESLRVADEKSDRRVSPADPPC